MTFDLRSFNRQIMRAYREMQEFNLRGLRLMSEAPPVSIASIMARVAEYTISYATGIAPYATGTLAHSHRGELQTEPGIVEAIIFLDPDLSPQKLYQAKCDYLT